MSEGPDDEPVSRAERTPQQFEIHEGDVLRMPLPDATFDAACRVWSSNTSPRYPARCGRCTDSEAVREAAFGFAFSPDPAVSSAALGGSPVRT